MASRIPEIHKENYHEWYRDYLKTDVCANRWKHNEPTQEEIDTHFQFVMTEFGLCLHLWTGWEALGRLNAFKKSQPSDIPLRIPHPVYNRNKFTASDFVEILDYIGLHCWKYIKNIPATEQWCEGKQMIHVIDELIQIVSLLSIREFMDMVRIYHPISISSILAVYTEDALIRAKERCLLIKEELMINRWHPSRVEKLLNSGYDVEDM